MAGTGRTGYWGWICTAEKGDRTTVLVFTDPRTGEEFDGALEEAERRRRVAQDPLAATHDQLTVTEDRANTAEDRVRALVSLVRQPSRQSPPHNVAE